ncbi:MAG: RNA polymerase sigma factor [Cyanobacteria bacterium]|nr:RNA polymerase sigma factor [Cyanobacteriota bacterium]
MMADAHSIALTTTYVPAAARGDRDAFEVVVDETRSLVSSIALAIVRDADLSRDVAQDVYLAAWRDLSQLRDHSSFLPWLRQLTRNRAYHVLRSKRRRARHLDDRDVDTLVGTTADPRPHAGDVMLADEERRLLAAVLDELPDEAREVVTLYYREGQSTAHVAALLGLSEANVRQRLARARVTLRRGLLDRYGVAAAKSAPDARFTAAVLVAVTAAAPSAASAATMTAVSSGAPWLAKVLAAGAGALLGAAGGIAGILISSRQLKKKARSIEELDAIKRFEFYSIFLVVFAAVMFPLSWAATRMPISQAIVFLGFITGLAGLHAFWLPRILRDRHVLEALEDPVRAARARKMERRAAILGWSLGLLFGSLGMIIGILAAS